MSTDGRGTADQTRGAGSRRKAAAAEIKAVAVEAGQRSQASIRARLSGSAGPAIAAASVAATPGTLLPAIEIGGLTGFPSENSAQPGEISTLPSAHQADSTAWPGDQATGSAAAAGQGQSAGLGGDADPASWAAESDRRIGPAIVRAADRHVPASLRYLAAWCWRLLLVAAVVYLSFKVVVALRLLVLPFIAAVLACALLQPLVAKLTRLGLPKLAATWVTLLVAIGVLTGVGMLITTQVQAGYPQLSAEVQHTVNQLQQSLSGPPFRLNGTSLHQLTGKLVTYLGQHKTVVFGTVVTGGKYFIEVLAGLVLTVFITFFLLKDGDMLWARLLRGFERFRGASADSVERSNRASGAAWQALVRYIHGTTIIAVIHGVLIGIALWLLGVPLILPIAILVFIAAYVPLVGILVVGALAILVTLATQGWVAAVILLAVFLLENQLESHLLQPLVIGRAVRLHPLEIIIVLAVGGIVAGVPGAIVAVPTAAVVSAAWRSNQEPLRRREVSADRPRIARPKRRGRDGSAGSPGSDSEEAEQARTGSTIVDDIVELAEPPSSATPSDPTTADDRGSDQ